MITQEVRIQLQFTMEIDATYSKDEIERRLNIMFTESQGHFCAPDMDLIRAEVIEIEEEAEIYGTEDNSGLEEYNKKYHIDKKRQTKLDL